MYFGLRQQQLIFIDLINERKIDEIDGKIINSLQKTFDVDIQLIKNTKQNVIKDFQIKLKQFDKMCCNIEQTYLQPKIKDQISKKVNLFNDSKIIQQQDQIQLLNKWLCQTVNNPQIHIQSKLLFRASQHNFLASQFHKFCDGKVNTLIIVKNNFNKIISGYTQNAWKSSKSFEPIKDFNGKSFVYSLNLKQKYKCFNLNSSIEGVFGFGARFGQYPNADISISDQYNINNCYSSLSSSFNLQINGIKKYKNEQKTYTQFIGNEKTYTFTILQYEVYQILGL